MVCVYTVGSVSPIMARMYFSASVISFYYIDTITIAHARWFRESWLLFEDFRLLLTLHVADIHGRLCSSGSR
jgi:hypothetical protein